MMLDVHCMYHILLQEVTINITSKFTVILDSAADGQQEEQAELYGVPRWTIIANPLHLLLISKI